MRAVDPTSSAGFPFVLQKKSGRATIYRLDRTDRVEFRVATYDTEGRRVMRSFPTFDLALSEAHQRLAAIAKGAGDAISLIGPDRLDYLAARQILPASVSLTDAARAWLRSQQGPKVTPIAVSGLVEAFIASRSAITRRGRGASPDYVRDLRGRLRRFSEAFRMNVADVRADQIEDWLANLGQQGRHRYNTLRLVRTLLKWAQKRGHLPPGPLATDQLEIVAPVDDAKIEIFSPEELTRFLNAAKPEMIPYLALGAFAGLRTAETSRLDWADVKLERGFIEVGADKAKTASRRLVPVLPALVAWLTPLRKPTGRVLPFANSAKQVGWLSQAAGVPWKHNALRHSYISYRLAEVQSVDRVALEAGNSPAMIFRHYRELVTAAQATAWFGVMPASSPDAPAAPKSAS
ncbi:MAG: hypothetical protein IT580_01530 [Verrucomicrobiales bacterium]|nr:hypothetical protein [Verrucomicrobiales bacterium]